MADVMFRLEDAEVKRDTERAILVSSPNIDESIWVPKSVISDDSDVWDATPDGCGPGTLVVQLWFAKKEGWA